MSIARGKATCAPVASTYLIVLQFAYFYVGITRSSADKWESTRLSFSRGDPHGQCHPGGRRNAVVEPSARHRDPRRLPGNGAGTLVRYMDRRLLCGKCADLTHGRVLHRFVSGKAPRRNFCIV